MGDTVFAHFVQQWIHDTDCFIGLHDRKVIYLSFHISKNYLLKPTDALAEKLIDSVVPYDQIVDQLIELGSFDDEYSYTEIDFINFPFWPLF